MDDAQRQALKERLEAVVTSRFPGSVQFGATNGSEFSLTVSPGRPSGIHAIVQVRVRAPEGRDLETLALLLGVPLTEE